MSVAFVLSIHAVVTVMMTGLIWFVQIVHYPLMLAVTGDGFVAYERLHTRRTGFVVGPLMLIEAMTAVAIVVLATAEMMRVFAWLGLGLLLVVWASTALFQVPCHRRLERAHDPAIIRRLVVTNWIRTVAWSARSVLAMLMIATELSP